MNRKRTLIYMFLAILFTAVSCEDKGTGPGTEGVEDEKMTGVPTDTVVTDIDGNIYSVVKIGEQYWLGSDLRVTRYRNGDSIEEVEDGAAWAELESGAFSYYNNESVNGETGGVLYNHFAVRDERKLVPMGWRVATDEDWKELERFLGMREDAIDYEGYRGVSEGRQLKTEIGWNYRRNGTDDYGFGAYPWGMRQGNDGEFRDLGNAVRYWCWDEENEWQAWFRLLGNNTEQIYRGYYDRRYGFNVRMVWND